MHTLGLLPLMASSAAVWLHSTREKVGLHGVGTLIPLPCPRNGTHPLHPHVIGHSVLVWPRSIAGEVENIVYPCWQLSLLSPVLELSLSPVVG